MNASHIHITLICQKRENIRYVMLCAFVRQSLYHQIVGYFVVVYDALDIYITIRNMNHYQTIGKGRTLLQPVVARVVQVSLERCVSLEMASVQEEVHSFTSQLNQKETHI